MRSPAITEVVGHTGTDPIRIVLAGWLALVGFVGTCLVAAPVATAGVSLSVTSLSLVKRELQINNQDATFSYTACVTATGLDQAMPDLECPRFGGQDPGTVADVVHAARLRRRFLAQRPRLLLLPPLPCAVVFFLEFPGLGVELLIGSGVGVGRARFRLS